MKNEQTSKEWTDRERDSTTTLWGVLVIFETLVLLLFVSEWFSLETKKGCIWTRC